MKIACICDWLTSMRGGEKCLQAFCQMYPHADIFTLVYYPENFDVEFEGHRITTSFIQKLPGNRHTFRKYLPLFPKAVESFDLSRYDLVVSFSHCVAKSVIVPDQIPHICYCHTPVRYAWHMRQAYLHGMNIVKKAFISHSLNRLQRWDRATADRVNHFIANSQNVQQRIQFCYDRDSKVIYPPVDVDRFTVSDHDQGYYLVMSALVPYKRIDLAVETFNKNGKRLLIAGAGPEMGKLKKSAQSNIEFVIAPDDRTVEKLYADCIALIFPGHEDFGIVPLEAQASGKPIIAYAKGGALETVIDIASSVPNPTGVFFNEQTQESLQKAIDKFEASRHKIQSGDCRHNAQRFNVSAYKSQMADYIEKILDR